MRDYARRRDLSITQVVEEHFRDLLLVDRIRQETEQADEAEQI